MVIRQVWLLWDTYEQHIGGEHEAELLRIYGDKASAEMKLQQYPKKRQKYLVIEQQEVRNKP